MIQKVVVNILQDFLVKLHISVRRSLLSSHHVHHMVHTVSNLVSSSLFSDSNCSGADCDGPSLSCPSDSRLQDGKCACDASLCKLAPVCYDHQQLVLSRVGTRVPGDCCDTHECLDKPGEHPKLRFLLIFSPSFFPIY